MSSSGDVVGVRALVVAPAHVQADARRVDAVERAVDARRRRARPTSRNSASGRSANSVWRSIARSGASICSSRPRSTIARYSVRSASATARDVLLARRRSGGSPSPTTTMPGDARGHERLGERRVGDERALGVELGGVAVGHLADRRRRGHAGRPCIRSNRGQRELEVVGVLEQVAHQRAVAACRRSRSCGAARR